MSQASQHLRLTESSTPLPGLPAGPLSAQQQLEALRRVQAQAEQRVQLGMQLFKATEAHTEQQQSLADELRHEQKQMREKIQQDVARSLRCYDQWVGRIDDGFAEAMTNLDQRLEKLRGEWSGTQRRIEQMMKRSEVLLEQNRLLHTPVESRKRPDSTVSVAPPQPPRETPTPANGSPQIAEAPPDDESKPIYGELLRRLLENSEGEEGTPQSTLEGETAA